MIAAIIIILALAALYLFSMWPAPASDEARGKFARRSYAHRGLYKNGTKRPENSLPAFEAAMQKGYGCELDVQFTRDKQLIVFHDNDYKRSSGVDKNVWDVDYAEAKTFPLFGSGETVPLFSEVLNTVAGRGPLLVEIKAEGLNFKWYAEVCAETLRQLREYNGDWCVESFHPYAVRWFMKNAPDAVRGQLVNGRRSSPNLSAVVGFIVEILSLNFTCRPNFIAYKEQDANFSMRLAQKLGAMTVMWTVRTPERQAELEKTEDAIIFENYEPHARY